MFIGIRVTGVIGKKLDDFSGILKGISPFPFPALLNVPFNIDSPNAALMHRKISSYNGEKVSRIGNFQFIMVKGFVSTFTFFKKTTVRQPKHSLGQVKLNFRGLLEVWLVKTGKIIFGVLILSLGPNRFEPAQISFIRFCKINSCQGPGDRMKQFHLHGSAIFEGLVQ